MTSASSIRNSPFDIQHSPQSAIEAVRVVVNTHWPGVVLRPLQEEAIVAVAARHDLLAVMPTGYGKSLCYQAPALTGVGCTIVVTPLIALMEDQVESLHQRSIGGTACLHSNKPPRAQALIESALMRGVLCMLYCSPERLMDPAFLTMLTTAPVSSIVVDEAHCISQWGHDFRPAYKQLAQIRKVLPGVPIHAFTATAPPEVRKEIIEVLGLRDPIEIVGSFDRPNLHLSVVPRGNGEWRMANSESPIRNPQSPIRTPESFLLDFIEAHRGQDGIVYCATRRETERLAKLLTWADIDARPYHAGLDADTRREVQTWCMAPPNRAREEAAPTPNRAREEAAPTPNRDREGAADPQRVVVATIAFGMGIDKTHVRWVVHTTMPSSIETYHQEIGRAGRDGSPAECVILFDPMDYNMWEERFFGDDSITPERHNILSAHAADMRDYCLEVDCRHATLTEYFGQRSAGFQPASPECGVASLALCNACDNCDHEQGERMKDEDRTHNE